MNKSSGNISSCCRNDKFTAYGYVWSYCELTRDEVLKRFILSEKLQHNHKNNALSKKVLQFDKDMNFITSYPSTQEAGRRLFLIASRINAVCRGERRSTHGFIFKYEENMTKIN